MTGWVEIMAIAFTTQLAVLPGEKVQFIIAGLSTRYNPLVVVAAAGSAFAGWTVLEILFGSAIRDVLPQLYLDVLTALLFLAFAVMLYRSAPAPNSAARQTDGGLASANANTAMERMPDLHVLEGRLPESVVTFLGIFLMMAVGEFGDKTQTVTIGLAAQFGATPAIWAGEMLAIIPVSLLNAFFFHRYAPRFDLRKAHFAAAALFAVFGLDMLQSKVTGFSLWETLVGSVAELLMTFVGLVA